MAVKKIDTTLSKYTPKKKSRQMLTVIVNECASIFLRKGRIILKLIACLR